MMTKNTEGCGPTIACACGCGATFTAFDAKGRPRAYLQGHRLKAISAAHRRQAVPSAEATSVNFDPTDTPRP